MATQSPFFTELYDAATLGGFRCEQPGKVTVYMQPFKTAALWMELTAEYVLALKAGAEPIGAVLSGRDNYICIRGLDEERVDKIHVFSIREPMEEGRVPMRF